MTAASTALRLAPIRYRHPDHEHAPHVLNFSGGRSSAALAFMSAECGLLKPERGDVVVFANTSAEHPGTYDFTAECKRRLESEFGLPVLWYEFCTVEDAATGGDYRRKLAYRLVKPQPLSDEQPDGFRRGGEVFEEFVAFQGMLPTAHSRTCTAKMKLFPAHLLLADWLGGTDGPVHDGHHFVDVDGEPERLVTADNFVAAYRARRGVADESYVRERADVLGSRLPSRAAQRWTDFTGAPIVHNLAGGATTPHAASMFGRKATQHIKLLGLRADEPKRVQRIEARSLLAEGAGGSVCRVATQPPGERPYFPLAESDIDEAQVREFWSTQNFDLDIPTGAGNCTFCFMKGTKQLVTLGKLSDPRRETNTPSDIAWWGDIEDRFARHAPARDKSGESRFGFFGVNSKPLRTLISEPPPARSRYETGTPACDCTD